jgi:hypothetical protein
MQNFEEFYSEVLDVIKDEINFTGTYQGKLFALVNDGTPCRSICTTDIPNKNLDDVADLFVKVMETKQKIDGFPKKLREDGNNPMCFAHTELFYSENQKKLVFIKIDIDDDGDTVVRETNKYEIKENEIFVDENGNLIKNKTKLIEVDE